MRKAAEIFRRAFPDWRSDLRQLIAEGDPVAENFTAHGARTDRARAARSYANQR
jgi:predicted ester cyclase